MPNFDQPKPVSSEVPKQETNQEYFAQEALKNVQLLLTRLEDYKNNLKRYEQLLSLRSRQLASLKPEELSEIDGALGSLLSEIEKSKKYVDIYAGSQAHLTNQLLGKPEGEEE